MTTPLQTLSGEHEIVHCMTKFFTQRSCVVVGPSPVFAASEFDLGNSLQEPSRVEWREVIPCF